MSIKDQVSAEQWKVLLNAPSAASAYVSTASGGVFEMFKEMFTAVKSMQDSAAKAGGSGYGALVDDLLTTIKGMSMQDAQASAVQYQSKDPAGLRAEAKKIVADGVAVAETLPGADGYKRWILDVARQVAETKTGGILGMGGTSVIDEKEQAALDELKVLSGM